MLRHLPRLLLVIVMMSSVAAAQEPPPQPDQVREALRLGQTDDAWRLVERMPAGPLTLALAIDVALATPTPRVATERLGTLARVTAEVVLAGPATHHALACAVRLRIAADESCERLLRLQFDQGGASVFDQVELRAIQARMSRAAFVMPAGWEAQFTGSTALEVATWLEIPAASRVRLLEPMLTSTDVGTLVSAVSALQAVPGPEALAALRRLSIQPPDMPGIRTLVAVGLARHGDAESLKLLAPHEASLPVRDRALLALGRAERGDTRARTTLAALVASSPEADAVQAAEALASLGETRAIDPAVLRFIRDGSKTLRPRWLAVAANLRAGGLPEIVRLLGEVDDYTRLLAAVAVAASATSPAGAGLTAGGL